MTRVATIVPAESDLLCEGCGYTLNGLPDHSNCPECGKPIAESIGSQRQVPQWERPGGQTLSTFLALTAAVVFRPTRFYKNLATRREIKPARRFATIHWLITALFFGLGMYGHLGWYLRWGLTWMGISEKYPGVLLAGGLILLTYVVLHGMTFVAARLTTWEATYRGIRLPINVVLRGMYYHAAHYVPVALAVAVTVFGFRTFEFFFPARYYTTYLYVLCGEVILFAGYLFNTYWIGMRNMMYANR